MATSQTVQFTPSHGTIGLVNAAWAAAESGIDTETAKAVTTPHHRVCMYKIVTRLKMRHTSAAASVAAVTLREVCAMWLGRYPNARQRASVAEWSIALGCKPSDFGLRRFESCPAHKNEKARFCGFFSFCTVICTYDCLLSSYREICKWG